MSSKSWEFRQPILVFSQIIKKVGVEYFQPKKGFKPAQQIKPLNQPSVLNLKPTKIFF
jgi:hypothetical protein